MYKVITSKTIFYEFCKMDVNMFNQCFYTAFIISVTECFHWKTTKYCKFNSKSVHINYTKYFRILLARDKNKW